jgi:Cdc6-like AAA superfamily ATPase
MVGLQMSQYAHLNSVARVQAELGDAERIRALYGARWIPYPRAQRALDRLNFLFEFPKCARMQGLLLYGDSGIGKTMVVEKFLRDHPSAYDKSAGIERLPVLAIQMPPAPDERRFYAQLLTAAGAPIGLDERLTRLESRCLRLLETLQIQMIVIDEVHHLLAGTAREQRRALNLLKFLANELRVSIATIGTSDAMAAIQTDQQIASRFEPMHLPRWASSDELRGFLAAYVKGLPLREPSNVSDQASLNLVLARSGGVTGRMALILSRAAELAIRKGEEAISLKWLDLSSRSLDLAAVEAA